MATSGSGVAVNTGAGMVDKWGPNVAERGFAQVPNYLLLLNQFIDHEFRLNPLELLLLVQIAGTWWKKGELPFPSMRTLAKRCGSSERQILRAMNKLEELGLIKRVSRRTKGIIASNAYDLMPLVEMLQEISKMYPNEFPRDISKAARSEISSRLRKPQDQTAGDPEDEGVAS